MVRRLFLLAAVAWILGAFFLWPVGQPVGRTLVDSGSGDRSLVIAGFNGRGQMVVTNLVVQPSVILVGPIELYDAATGERISTLYSGDERLDDLNIDRGLAVTSTGRAVRVVSLDDRVVIEHAGNAQSQSVGGQLSPGAARFLAQDGLKLTVYDVPTARILWSRDGVRRAAWMGDDSIQLWLNGTTDQPSDSVNEFVCANALTGSLVRGNRKIFAAAHERRLSPDGRLAWWISSGSPSEDPTGLYDIETNRLLWGMDIVQQNGMDPIRMRHLHFSSDSSELHYFYHVPEHRWGIARWRVSDGECLAPLPANAHVAAAPPTLAPDGRWSASSKSELRTRLAPVPPIVWEGPAWLSKWIADYITATSRTVQVCDNVNNRLIASIPDERILLTAAPDGTCLFLHGGRTITRYEVPPKMAYGQFLLCAMLPAAGLLLAGRFLPRKKQRHPQIAPAEQFAATTSI